MWILSWVIGETWVILLPVVLALIVCTVLWPPVRWFARQGASAGRGGAARAGGGDRRARRCPRRGHAGDHQPSGRAGRAGHCRGRRSARLAGRPPLNISDAQLNSVVEAINDTLNSSSAKIASGLFTGVGAATSALVTLYHTAIVVAFFFLKDGPRFLPWLRHVAGSPRPRTSPRSCSACGPPSAGSSGPRRRQPRRCGADRHRAGRPSASPLAYALAILTFIVGFVPIVGAFVAGGLAVLIALVANGPVNALIVLGIIVAVQQLEGNVLQPWLQAKSMKLHAVIVLLAVTLGARRCFGVIGAFLAVPVAATVAVILRYYDEQVAGRVDDEETAEADDTTV